MGKLIHRAWDWKRTRYIPGVMERVFADEWEKTCQSNPGINFGHGTLQDMLIDSRDGGIFRKRRVVAWITNREAMIVATIIQWLGTNCGFAWLSSTLQKAGFRLEKNDESDQSARVKVVFSAEKAAIMLYFKRTFQMERIERMPAHVNQSEHDFRRNFKYLCDVGLCEKLERGKDKYASLTKEGVELIQFAIFGGLGEDGKNNSILKLSSYMPLRWLEQTKLPFEFVEKTESVPSERVKVTREERIEAIKKAQLERINSRKFGELVPH